MLQRTVEQNGVKITARERINQDLYDGTSVLIKLEPEPDAAKFRRNQFLLAVLQTISIEGLPFEWVTFASSGDDIRAAYKAWCELNPDIGAFWSNTIYDLNNTVADTALRPIAAGE